MTAKSELLGAFVFLLSSSEKEASPTITLLATLGAGKKRTCHDKDEVCTIITSDPLLTTTVLTSLGGFKVVQLDHCRVIYGADGDGIGTCVQNAANNAESQNLCAHNRTVSLVVVIF